MAASCVARVWQEDRRCPIATNAHQQLLSVPGYPLVRLISCVRQKPGA
jgi:hypothetical protein